MPDKRSPEAPYLPEQAVADELVDTVLPPPGAALGWAGP